MTAADAAVSLSRGPRKAMLALSCLPLYVAPALAQDDPIQGIGFVQAMAGAFLCRHERPDEALACAREHCAEQAPGEECWPTAWCFPANWSGVMSVQLPDVQATQVLCGAPTEAALTEGLRAFCAADEEATRCDLTLVVDPEGNERTVEGLSFPGPAAPPADADAPVQP